MIKLVEDKESIIAMTDYCADDPFGCRIMATYRTYGVEQSFAQFWLQRDEKSGKVTAVLGSLDNGLTVCAKGDYNTEEIDSFVRMLAGENGALRPVRKNEVATGLVMRLDRSALIPPVGDIEINPPCEELYTVLENCPGLGFDVPPFEAFYADMRLRTKLSTAISGMLRSDIMPVSCAAVHRAANVGLLTMCATVPEFRGKGCGSSCVRALIGHLREDEELFVFCLPGMCGYYEKMGFRVVGGFVY
ncbi:MAG: GNAT family N-acetyltransferase [Ruminococcaceae bacterium]|nr:GNAT family N-acetyltransferase [Oscillospiraceae bacterium]